MKFLISGADRDTGKEKTATIDASSEDEAMGIARKWNWLVSDIRPMTAMDYQPPAATVAVPEYQTILTGAMVLQVIGFLFYCLAAVVIALGVVGFMKNPGAPETQITLVASVVLTVVMLLASGAIMQMIGALALAHRDLVRNSFR